MLSDVFHEFTKERHVFLNVFHENVDGTHVFHADALAAHVFMKDVEEDVPFLGKFMKDVSKTKKNTRRQDQQDIEHHVGNENQMK